MSTEPATAVGELGRDAETPFRIAQLARLLKAGLEASWPDVWVEGEITDVSVSTAGHIYFTLSDPEEPAKLYCALFRGEVVRGRPPIEKGRRVRARGKLTYWPQGGRLQLVARALLEAGAGDRAARVERLLRQLMQEGLLAKERKRPLPRLPRAVGVVTSLGGAAIHDILRVTRERCPMRIVVADCRVQGAEAPESIARALDAIAQVEGIDVVIVGRGGGAADELAAFDTELVARAIARCPVPVVSAVGHETDTTVADLVADVRAATPSNAAELAVPDARALRSELERLRVRLIRGIERCIDRQRAALQRVAGRLRDPRAALRAFREPLRALGRRLERAMRTRLREGRDRLGALGRRLAQRDPRATLARHRATTVRLHERLRAALSARLAHARASLGALAARLDALSPLAVLGRGYAIALHVPTGRALTRARDARVGDALEIVLAEGRLDARVEAVRGQPDTRDLE